MPRELRMSSLYEVPPQPRWLVRLQIVGVVSQLIALTVMFCHIAFGMWSQAYSIAVLPLQAVFLTSQLYVYRWNRSRKAT
jgi:hypothetical protein